MPCRSECLLGCHVCWCAEERPGPSLRVLVGVVARVSAVAPIEAGGEFAARIAETLASLVGDLDDDRLDTEAHAIDRAAARSLENVEHAVDRAVGDRLGRYGLVALAVDPPGLARARQHRLDLLGRLVDLIKKTVAG